ncbi:hypothetical protein [Methanoregula sp.]|jgi:hypothetical protein|uniref:hypothetical protein n=1 Tax=Methanoregula sp. TaxID=2052170 RepID=UPI003C270CA3
MSGDPEKQKLLAEQRKTNLLKKCVRREIQQGRIKHGRDGIIAVPEPFRNLLEFETWLHQKVCLKPSAIPREYVGYFTKGGGNIKDTCESIRMNLQERLNGE